MMKDKELEAYKRRAMIANISVGALLVAMGFLVAILIYQNQLSILAKNYETLLEAYKALEGNCFGPNLNITGVIP